VVEARPGELVVVAHGTTSGGEEGLLAWRVKVERAPRD
jgi:hypothetical protein